MFELLICFTEYGGLDAALLLVEKITWAGKRALVRSWSWSRSSSNRTIRFSHNQESFKFNCRVINPGFAHRHNIAAPQVYPAVTFVVSWPLKTKAEKPPPRVMTTLIVRQTAGQCRSKRVTIQPQLDHFPFSRMWEVLQQAARSFVESKESQHFAIQSIPSFSHDWQL